MMISSLSFAGKKDVIYQNEQDSTECETISSTIPWYKLAWKLLV